MFRAAGERLARTGWQSRPDWGRIGLPRFRRKPASRLPLRSAGWLWLAEVDGEGGALSLAGDADLASGVGVASRAAGDCLAFARVG